MRFWGATDGWGARQGVRVVWHWGTPACNRQRVEHKTSADEHAWSHLLCPCTHASLAASCVCVLTKPTRVGPYVVPAGVNLFPSLFVLNNYSVNWGPDAREFKPERWEDPKIGINPATGAPCFPPFSSGPKNCIGMALEQVVVRSAVALMLSTFRWVCSQLLRGLGFCQMQVVGVYKQTWLHPLQQLSPQAHCWVHNHACMCTQPCPVAHAAMPAI
jgi:hypothetical protein